MNRKPIQTICVVMFLLMPSQVLAAVGCTLTDPDRDIMRIFPEATNYKTEFISIAERGGAAFYAEIEEKLGDKMDSIYETADVPYAYYTVLKGKQTIGYVHGVNQKGMYGGMQLILATDLDGKILDFYYQKISSPEVKVFRSEDFIKQLRGLSLADFYESNGRVSAIQDPSQHSVQDFQATLRGIKKNLILHDAFMLNRKHDAYRERSAP